MLFAVTQLSYGQIATTPEELQRKSFLELRDRREVLDRDIAELQTQVSSLAQKLRDRNEAEQEAAGAKMRYEESKNNPMVAPELKSAFRRAMENAQVRLEGMAPKEDLKKQLDDEVAKLVPKQNEKNAIESRMSELIDMERPKQEFKGLMSKWFIGLVAVVIGGFFSRFGVMKPYVGKSSRAKPACSSSQYSRW
jgi:DNA repair exonuclease SbcCD ATPase subunit